MMQLESDDDIDGAMNIFRQLKTVSAMADLLTLHKTSNAGIQCTIKLLGERAG
jgi:hypothetical protein